MSHATPSFLSTTPCMKSVFITFIISIIIVCTSNISYSQNCSINAGVPQSICYNETAVFLVGNISNTNTLLNTLQWSVAAEPIGSSVTINNPTSPTSSVSGVNIAGEYLFAFQVECADGQIASDTTRVTLLESPTQASTPASSIIGCYNGGGITISGNTPQAGETGLWTFRSGTRGTIVSPTSPSTLFFPDPDNQDCRTGANSYNSILEYRISNNDCSTSSTTTLRYTYNENPFFVDATPKQSCGNCTQLSASCNLDGTGTWTYTGPGTAIFEPDANSVNAAVCVDLLGDYTFTWSVVGGCNPGTGDVTVSFQDFGINERPPDAGENQVFCSMPTTISLNAMPLNTNQSGNWSQLSGRTATITDPTSPSTTVSGIEDGGGPYQFVWEASGLTCTLSDTVTIGQRPDWQFVNMPDLPCTPTVNADEIDVFKITPVLADLIGDFQVTINFLEVPAGYENEIALYPQFSLSDSEVFGPKVGIDVFGDGSAIDTMSVGTPLVYNITREMIDNTLGLAFQESDHIGMVVAFEPYNPRGDYEVEIVLTDECGSYYYQREYTISGFSTLNSNAGTDVILDCGIDKLGLVGAGLTYVDPIAPVNPASIHVGAWYTLSGPSDPFTDSIRYSATPVLTDLLEGVYTFRYMSLFGSECEPSYDDISVTINLNAPTAVSGYLNQLEACGSGPVQLIGDRGTNPETYTPSWVIVSPTQTSEVLIPQGDTLIITDLLPNTTYMVEYLVTNNCNHNSSTVTFTTNNETSPSLADILEEEVCLTTETSYDLMAAALVQGTGTWSLVSAPAGASISIASPNNNQSLVSGLTEDGVYAFEWTTSNPPCLGTSSDIVYISRGTALATYAGDDQQICGVSFPYVMNLGADMAAAGSTGEWQFFSGPTIPTFGDVNAPTTSVTFEAPGVYELVWETSIGNCSFQSDQLTIIIGDPAPDAFAGSDQSSCATSNVFSLDALDLGVGEVGLWTVAATTGTMTVSFADVADPNTTVSLSSGGTATLEWTTFAEASSCSNKSDQVEIEWIQPANAGVDQVLCGVNNTILQGNDLSGLPGSTSNWTLVSGPNTPNITDPSNEITTVIGLTEGIYVFQYVTVSACFSSDQIQVEVLAPVLSDAGENLVVCSGDVISLDGNSPSGSTSSWELLSGNNTGSIADPNSANTTYSPASVGDPYIFSYALDIGPCTTYDYTVAFLLDESNIGTSTTEPSCGNDDGGIAVDLGILPMDNLTFLWNNGATTASISNLSAGNYEITVTSLNTGCSYSTLVPLQNTSGPNLVLDAQVETCPNQDQVLALTSITGGATPYTYNWSTGETTENITVASSNDQPYFLTVTDATGCKSVATYNYTVYTMPTVELGPSFDYCGGGSVALIPSITVADDAITPTVFTENNFDTGNTWVQESSDDTDWEVNSSNPADLYVVATGNASMSQTAVLLSPAYDFSMRRGTEMAFDYVFTGVFAQNLSLEASTDNWITSTQLWNTTTPTSTLVWQNQTVDISAYDGMTNVNFRFLGTTGNSAKNTIALDDIQFLDLNSSFSYAWDTGDNTQAITVTPSPPTTHTLTVTDPNGCPTSDNITITSCLPISIDYFIGGEVDDCKVHLIWQVLEEEGVEYFDIEKSTDGVNFASVGTIPSMGNSWQPRRYMMVDDWPEGTNYYRLKIVELDGTIEYYEEQIVVKPRCFKGLKIGEYNLYPNPSVGEEIFLDFNSPKSQPLTLTIFDIKGVKIKEYQVQANRFDNTFSMNVKNLTSGSYLLKIEDGEIAPKTVKFIRLEL